MKIEIIDDISHLNGRIYNFVFLFLTNSILHFQIFCSVYLYIFFCLRRYDYLMALFGFCIITIIPTYFHFNAKNVTWTLCLTLFFTSLMEKCYVPQPQKNLENEHHIYVFLRSLISQVKSTSCMQNY